MKHTLLDITQGMVVQLRGPECTCQFLGFTAHGHGNSKREDVKYADMGELMHAYLPTHTEADIDESLVELEKIGDVPLEGEKYAHSISAVFKDIDNGDEWGAYLYKGEWVYGSSADPIYPVSRVQDEPYFTEGVMDSPAYALERALANMRMARTAPHPYRTIQYRKLRKAADAFYLAAPAGTDDDTTEILGYDVHAPTEQDLKDVADDS